MNGFIKINDLSCSYNQGVSTILTADRIEFELGKVYFIIGKSGIGKSTLLEALGLMSDTIVSNAESIRLGSGTSERHIKTIWREADISSFRMENYSFIFQSNNLMENFTAGENMSFGLLLNGLKLGQAKNSILPLMDALDLPHELFDRPIQNLSGGQRQRLAFIRAITAPFRIMFCDEPTGNLDAVVARKLMNILREHIVTNHRMAIIVSHDIDLALKFADAICVIEEYEQRGRMLSNNIYTRDEDQWHNSQGIVIDEITQELKAALN